MKRAFTTHCLTALALAALAAASLSAQRSEDPDRAVKSSGTLPSGWLARLDGGSTKPGGVNVMQMGGGLHFMTGPAGVYYRSADTKSGSYEVRASFTQMEPSAHPEAYGLFIGGSNLDGAAQKYTYFLVRQDGKFLIKRRAGDQTPTLVNWTDSTAVKKTDASTKGTNLLAITVAPDKVRFLVNGTEVGSTPTSQVDASGIAGLRINHNLNVHVEGLVVK